MSSYISNIDIDEGLFDSIRNAFNPDYERYSARVIPAIQQAAASAKVYSSKLGMDLSQAMAIIASGIVGPSDIPMAVFLYFVHKRESGAVPASSEPSGMASGGSPASPVELQRSWTSFESYRGMRDLQEGWGSKAVGYISEKLKGGFGILSQFIKRRAKARNILSGTKCNLHTRMFNSQLDFWKFAQNCCASVHIPGSTSNCMDRGQLQLMGLGICTISPDIFCSLGDRRAEPNIHYVCIDDDFSNLEEKVYWCLEHREECIKIGNNAKKLFSETCTPLSIWQYIQRRLVYKTKPILL